MRCLSVRWADRIFPDLIGGPTRSSGSWMGHEPVSSGGGSEFEIFHVGIEVTPGEHNELLRLERPLVSGKRLVSYCEVVT